MPAPTAKLTKEVFESQYTSIITLDDLYKEFHRSYCYMGIKKSSFTMLTSKKKTPNNTKPQLPNSTDATFKIN